MEWASVQPAIMAVLGAIGGASGGIGIFKAVLDHRERMAGQEREHEKWVDELEQKFIERQAADNLALKQELIDTQTRYEQRQTEHDERCDRRILALEAQYGAVERRLEDCLHNRWDAMQDRSRLIGPEIPPERGQG